MDDEFKRPEWWKPEDHPSYKKVEAGYDALAASVRPRIELAALGPLVAPWVEGWRNRKHDAPDIIDPTGSTGRRGRTAGTGYYTPQSFAREVVIAYMTVWTRSGQKRLPTQYDVATEMHLATRTFKDYLKQYRDDGNSYPPELPAH